MPHTQIGLNSKTTLKITKVAIISNSKTKKHPKNLMPEIMIKVISLAQICSMTVLIPKCIDN